MCAGTRFAVRLHGRGRLRSAQLSSESNQFLRSALGYAHHFCGLLNGQVPVRNVDLGFRLHSASPNQLSHSANRLVTLKHARLVPLANRSPPRRRISLVRRPRQSGSRRTPSLPLGRLLPSRCRQSACASSIDARRALSLCIAAQHRSATPMTMYTAADATYGILRLALSTPIGALRARCHRRKKATNSVSWPDGQTFCHHDQIGKRSRFEYGSCSRIPHNIR